jgi:hypothetical protein
MITIQEFINKNNVPREVMQWAKQAGKSRMEELWSAPGLPHMWRVIIAVKDSVLTKITLEKFAVFCAHQVVSKAKDKRCHKALKVADKYLVDGFKSKDVLQAQEDAFFAKIKADHPYAYPARAVWCALSTIVHGDMLAHSFAFMASDAALQSAPDDVQHNYFLTEQSGWLLNNAQPNWEANINAKNN